jgi:branched-chain amino acid transport system substrate-binding protein
VAARLVVWVAAAVAAAGATTPGHGAAPSPCVAPKVGVLVPLTGQAARVGREQRDFARFAALRHNERSTLTVTLVERDTHLSPPDASAHAARLAADPSVLAVVGPAESDEVVAAGAAFGRRGLVFVSPSARRASLTDGSLPTFFRVIPHDGMQAPTLATFIRKTLAAARVVVTDDGSAYGVPLADALEKKLAATGVAVTRMTVDPELDDFAPALTTIKANADVVVLAWQQPDRAQVFADQLRAINKHAAVVGTDALDAVPFKLEGAYVSAPLPDVRAFERNADLLNRYRKRYGQFSTALGPPAYAAAQAAILAVRNACRDGKATRSEVRTWLRRTYVPDSILGNTIAFTNRGDVRGARFSLFHIESGMKRLVQ